MACPIKLRASDIAVLVAVTDLPPDLRQTLEKSQVEMSLTDDQLVLLNDACLRTLQEHGFDESGRPTSTGQALERVVDALNSD